MTKRVTGSVALAVGLCLPGASAWGQTLVNIRMRDAPMAC